MKITIYIAVVIIVIATAAFLILPMPRNEAAQTSAPAVSGNLVGGFRVLTVRGDEKPLHLTVYRGDYIKFDLAPSIQDPLLTIPDLDIRKPLEKDLARAPYFKMKRAGSYPFSIGTINGRIDVINYSQSRYAEVDSKTAARFIEESRPLILDVRTPGEYKRGHLPGAMLIPLQELQKRLKEIEAYKDREVLLYCATGNRSTVASKILIDNGFQHITNMRYGIADWARAKFTIAH